MVYSEGDGWLQNVLPVVIPGEEVGTIQCPECWFLYINTIFIRKISIFAFSVSSCFGDILLKKYKIHIALYPLSLIYGLITAIRNWLFDIELLKSTSFAVPVISVGNLAVGGTGKTPHTELIIGELANEWRVAVLSRGYKRKTRGFVLADESASSMTIGDEPFQIKQKFPLVTVAVCEKRVVGVKKLLALQPAPGLIVLDDAFQHRYVQAGFSILLTDYSNLYTRDYVMPAGRLREWKSGSKRANMVVVTKCPPELTAISMRLIERELNLRDNQLLFFSTYAYDAIQPVFSENVKEPSAVEDLADTSVLLVAGIVSPQAIVDYLAGYSGYVDSMFFPDHYTFEKKDYDTIVSRLSAMKMKKKLLLVTEKDAARMKSSPEFPDELKEITYALPIRVRILHNQEENFIQKIRNYVVENSRNR